MPTFIKKQISYLILILVLLLTYIYKQSRKIDDVIKFAKFHLFCIKKIEYNSSNIQKFLIFKIAFAQYQSIPFLHIKFIFYSKIIALSGP